MRSRLVLVLVLVTLSLACGPSPSQLRRQHVDAARAEAASRPGGRQAQSYASAVHAAYVARDYEGRPQALHADAAQAIAAIDQALPVAGVDAPTLVAWRALMFADIGNIDQALVDFQRSHAMAPNEVAGRNLVVIYGGARRPDLVGAVCAATVETLASADDRLSMIELCRDNMNAVSNEGEMAWMSPALVAWYQEENARRLGAEIDAMNARNAREAHERQVVRETEQCMGLCKERGLACQNRCHGDVACENRCVEINRSCLDRCESQAYQELDQ